jgi:uncharacterized membrane protein
MYVLETVIPSTDKNVCSGNGICTNPNNCFCNEGYSGSFCQYSLVNSIIGAVVGAFNFIYNYFIACLYYIFMLFLLYNYFCNFILDIKKKKK